MFCHNCGKQLADQAVVCDACGMVLRKDARFCRSCGAEIEGTAGFCGKCGTPVGAPQMQAQEAVRPALKSKLAAGLLGVFVGGLGIHRFYLGYNGIGVAQLVLALLGFLTCGITSIAAAIWGLIEGILILTGSINKDAQGNPLAE